jgi:hypothetical protein
MLPDGVEAECLEGILLMGMSCADCQGNMQGRGQSSLPFFVAINNVYTVRHNRNYYF